MRFPSRIFMLATLRNTCTRSLPTSSQSLPEPQPPIPYVEEPQKTEEQLKHEAGVGGPTLDACKCARTVLYCTVLYCTVLYCTVLYCTVLYCTVLYCTVL